METRQAIARILAGDPDGYSEIVARYRAMLVGFVGCRLPDKDWADEIVQLTFIRAYEHLAEFRSDQDFGVWLRVTCRYVLASELKRASRERKSLSRAREFFRRRRVVPALEMRDPEDDPDPLEQLETCLGRLEDRYRYVLEARYRHQAPVAQIARDLGRTVTWVTTVLFRLRKLLGRWLKARAEALA